MNTSPQLSPHFSLREFTASATADRLNIDNSLPATLQDNATHTCEQLEKIRAILGNNPLIITSGWRTPALNKVVGGSASSDHATARAVDIRCPKFGTARTIARTLAASDIEFDQLILESPTLPSAWVHIGFRKGANRRQVLTKFAGDKTYYAGLK
ncbi:YcbK family protein [Iodobacter fluviatilis]|uniref:Peptidase M15 n=1 Tax=Iodobacter fluviatilis TaxID=537 RepID=A0A377Q3B7_9NEIS|nr:D-Ala-D-Ala carboxypeptidase family metallohydrolase [Iodobacter fluviatilis]TCU90270.1 peptidase M15-like protein [Iodobacter fluviatilis]STQ89297.1 Peptidase M15 [Iodobacter fluviatilis]